ncbi:hypothetical protein ACE4Z5_26375, partial [Salmonella enterica]|uniref:hypothetical protein n=1 Tax=Salmonella enterica TaxID=28901 RepID=UPI003D2C579C
HRAGTNVVALPQCLDSQLFTGPETPGDDVEPQPFIGRRGKRVGCLAHRAGKGGHGPPATGAYGREKYVYPSTRILIIDISLTEYKMS